MSKKNKNKQKTYSDNTAFTKSDWFGKSRRQRQRRNNHGNPKNVSRETYPKRSDTPIVTITIDEFVESTLQSSATNDTGNKTNNP